MLSVELIRDPVGHAKHARLHPLRCTIRPSFKPCALFQNAESIHSLPHVRERVSCQCRCGIQRVQVPAGGGAGPGREGQAAHHIHPHAQPDAHRGRSAGASWPCLHMLHPLPPLQHVPVSTAPMPPAASSMARSHHCDLEMSLSCPAAVHS